MTDKNSKVRALSEFLILSVILGIAAFFSYNKIDSMLKNSLEESVALQSRTIAFSIERQFKEQLNDLKSNAKFIEQNRFETENLIKMLTNKYPGKKMGIIRDDFSLAVGNSLDADTIKLFQKVFDGESLVKYRKNVGLIFAVPINFDGQNCILYKCYNDEAFRNEFEVLSYNGAGTVILLNTREDWTVVADGKILINTHPDMRAGWEKLGKKLFDGSEGELVTDSGATYYKFHDEDYFIYFSKVEGNYKLKNPDGFAISGYVPLESVAVGIDYIYKIMLVTFFAIFLCLIFGVRYMMKKRQAKFFEQEKLLADSANQAKSSFLSNMSHEIRTPINAIMGMNEMVIRETEDKNILEYSENLQNAAKTLLGLVNDILDFSKIEAGKMEIIPVEYHLSSLLNDLVNMIETRSEKKGLKFIVEADKNLPSILFGDEIRIKQVVTNILTNAVKYTEKGSVTLKISFSAVDDEKISLKISVADTGIGIKPEDMKKLFSAFERIEEKRNRSIEGTGLGMNITQQLLNLMDSKLEVSSVYGEGSEFSFEISQKVISKNPIGNFQENYHQSLSRRKKYQKTFTAPDAKILVVDDTPMNLTVLKGLLKQTKIQIETCESGYECLNLVTKKIYDVIFLDHKMPGLDGIETLQEMKKLPNNLNKKTPIISLTANAVSGAREQYISAGFQDYLTKPIDSVQLEKLLTDYLPSEKISYENNVEEKNLSEEKIFPDWLKKIDGLNVEEGIKYCGGFEEFMAALKIFVNSIESGAEEIKNFYANEDWKNYTTKVHALKSSARVIGAKTLSDLAKNLEDAGNANNLDEIKNKTSTLIEIYRSFSEKLAPLIEVEEENFDKPLISEEELNEAYETLKEISASFDYDSLEFVLQSLENYKLPEKEVERYKKIKNAASKLDWESIISNLR